jgi:hypothetical protein
MEEVEQRDIDSHGDRFIAGEPQVQPRGTVIGDEWAKRYKTPLVEKVSFRRDGSRPILVICFHHVAPAGVVGRATSE